MAPSASTLLEEQREPVLPSEEQTHSSYAPRDTRLPVDSSCFPEFWTGYPRALNIYEYRTKRRGQIDEWQRDARDALVSQWSNFNVVAVLIAGIAISALGFVDQEGTGMSALSSASGALWTVAFFVSLLSVGTSTYLIWRITNILPEGSGLCNSDMKGFVKTCGRLMPLPGSFLMMSVLLCCGAAVVMIANLYPRVVWVIAIIFGVLFVVCWLLVQYLDGVPGKLLKTPNEKQEGPTANIESDTNT